MNPIQPPSDQDRKRLLKTLGLLSVIMAELGGSIGVGIGSGYLLVNRLNAPGWVLALTSFLGFCLGMYRIYQISKRDWDQNSDDQDGKS